MSVDGKLVFAQSSTGVLAVVAVVSQTAALVVLLTAHHVAVPLATNDPSVPRLWAAFGVLGIAFFSLLPLVHIFAVHAFAPAIVFFILDLICTRPFLLIITSHSHLARLSPFVYPCLGPQR